MVSTIELSDLRAINQPEKKHFHVLSFAKNSRSEKLTISTEYVKLCILQFSRNFYFLFMVSDAECTAKKTFVEQTLIFESGCVSG